MPDYHITVLEQPEMSIRKNTTPRPLELPPEMRDILARNGMRGHIAGSSEGFVLIVQGHDSPLLSYPITEKQLQALTDWGTNYANRKCYNTFASIVAADFDLPKGTVVMDGNDLAYINPDKGWFREGRHGREVTVNQIRVEPAEAEGKYRMTAVIDGETVSHEITQKQYDKFMVIDDYHRLKLFSKIFGEVDMKSRDNIPLGTKIGAALLAGVAVMGELGRGPRPDIYLERHGSPPPRCYFKPGVDTPMDVAARNYEAAVNTERMQHELRHGM